MIDVQTTLSTINEENESELSTLTITQSENCDEDYEDLSTNDVENESKSTMRSKTFSVDSNASSYQCFREIIMSSSSVFQNPFYFFPDLEDPGIQDAFRIIDEQPINDNGCQAYKDMCKNLEIYPISKVCKSLNTKQLNLKYYVPCEKQMRAICKTLENNTYIQELNLQDNWLSVNSCTYLATVLEQNTTLKILKLKECRIGAEGMRKLCRGLVENQSLQWLSLAWNGIATEQTVFPFVRYLKKSVTLKFLDMSNNLIGGPSLNILMKGVAESRSLEHLKIGNNLFSPQKAYHCAEILSKDRDKPLKLIDMENMVVQKKFLNLMEHIRQRGKNVIYGAVLTNYEIHGPYLPKVLFGRCKYLGMKPKKKKNRINFGHFVLSLPQKPISAEEFKAALTARKLDNRLDSNLIAAVQDHYTITKTRKIDCSQLASDYIFLYPDTQPETLKKKKSQKAREENKYSKKNKKGYTDEPLNKGTERKLSFVQTEREETKSSKGNPTNTAASSTKMTASKSSLKSSSSNLKKKRQVSYANLEETKEIELMNAADFNVESEEVASSALNASGVFFL